MKDVPYLLIPTKFGYLAAPLRDDPGIFMDYSASSHVKMPELWRRPGSREFELALGVRPIKLENLTANGKLTISRTHTHYLSPEQRRQAVHAIFKGVAEEAQRTTGADYLHITHKKYPEKHAIDFKITPYYKK